MTDNEPDFEKMTDAEIADWQYAHKDELDDDLEDAEEVEVEVAKPLEVTTSFRMTAEEAAFIRSAAKDAKMSVSQWIRQACLNEATSSSEKPHSVRGTSGRRTWVFATEARRDSRGAPAARIRRPTASQLSEALRVVQDIQQADADVRSKVNRAKKLLEDMASEIKH